MNENQSPIHSSFSSGPISTSPDELQQQLFAGADEPQNDKILLSVDKELLNLVKLDVVLVRRLVQSDAETFARLVALMPGLIRIGILAAVQRSESLLAGEKNPPWKESADIDGLKNEIDTLVAVLDTESEVVKDFAVEMKNILDEEETK